MTYTPDHILAHVTYRQELLRRDAEARRHGRTVRVVPRAKPQRVRRAAERVGAAATGRVRRSLYALTEWPRPV